MFKNGTDNIKKSTEKGIKMFKIGLSSGGNKEICPKLFENYKKAGIDVMELDPAIDMYDILDYKEVRRMAEKNDINLWSFHLPFKPFAELDISSSDEKLRAHSVKYTAELIKKAADIGIDKFVVHSGGITKRKTEQEVEERISYACESYAALAEIAARDGGTVVVENLPPVCVGKDIVEVEKLLSADSRLRLCFDTNHLLSGDDHAEFIRHFKDKIITLHISDYDFINERHWLPGEGKIDWQSVLKALLDINYKGPWLYEIAFVSLPTLKRVRDLTCEDFVRNAKEIFENKTITIIEGYKPEPKA